jgi:hypothetical protein
MALFGGQELSAFRLGEAGGNRMITWSVTFALSCLAAELPAAAPTPDLTRVERAIRKEPAYKTQNPRYDPDRRVPDRGTEISQQDAWWSPGAGAGGAQATMLKLPAARHRACRRSRGDGGGEHHVGV